MPATLLELASNFMAVSVSGMNNGVFSKERRSEGLTPGGERGEDPLRDDAEVVDDPPRHTGTGMSAVQDLIVRIK